MDSRLTAAVVHDLKNSLGLLEAQLALLANEPEASESLRQAHENCFRLRLRLLEFLTLYQADQGKLRTVVEDHDPEAFLREVAADFGEWAGPTVEQIVQDDVPKVVFFDRRLVSLALHAALSNAKAFAVDRILLGVRKEGRRVVFFVLDDGPGLGAGATPGGAGLGMTVAELAATAHTDGLVSGEAVLKTAPNGGALFELRLPG